MVGARASIEGYEIERLVARGDGGVVYRARDRRLDRPVAIRVVSPELATDPVTRARLNRECTVLAQLDHPNVVPLYDVGESDGHLYIVTRWLDGVDLGQFVKALHPLDAGRAARLVLQVCSAVQAAHDRGVLHRAMRPSKALVARGNHVYVTDFGVARRSTDSTGLTPANQMVDSLDHLAPEQISGDPVDERTDVYGLGCILYQALAGEVPFPDGTYAAKLYAVRSTAPPSVRDLRPDIPADLDAAICRAMAKDLGRRQPSVTAFAEEVAVAVGLTRPPWIPRAEGARPAPAVGDGRGPDPRENEEDPSTTPPSAWRAGAPGPPPTRPQRPPAGPRDAPPDEPREPPPSGGPVSPGARGRSRRLARRLLIGAGLLLFAAVPVGLVLVLRDRDAGPRTVHVAPAASAVAVSGGRVWVATPDRRAVRVSGTRTAAASSRSVSVGAPVRTLVASPDSVLVAAGRDLVEISSRDPGRIERTRLSAPAGALAVGEGGSWAALSGRPALVRVRGGRVSRIPLTARASSLSAGEGVLWVADADRGTVLAVDERTGFARGRRTRVGRRPVAIAAAPGAIWVALAGQKALVRLDPRTRRIRGAPIPLSGEPSALAADARQVWVTRRRDNAVTKLDARTGRTLAELGTAAEPVSVALGRDAAWVVGARGDLARIPR